MNVKNCRSCGKLFNYIGGMPICPACKEEAEKKYQVAREYIRDHRGATVSEVSRECEVEEAQIRQWVREERLVFDTESGIGMTCESCGASIPAGRICDKCKANLISGLKAAGRQPVRPQQPQKATRENPRMRFLDGK